MKSQSITDSLELFQLVPTASCRFNTSRPIWTFSKFLKTINPTQPDRQNRLVHRRFCPRCRRRQDEGYCDGFPPPEETHEESKEGVLGVKKEE